MTQESRRTAPRDLAFFRVPPGFSKELFVVYIGSLFLQQPIVRSIDSFVVKQRSFAEVEAHIKGKIPVQGDGDQAPEYERILQTLMRWMPYFLPGRYRFSGENDDTISRT